MDTANRPDGEETTVFRAVVTPHRSLSREGFVLFMGCLCMVSFAAGLIFLSMGAWPVFGFFGLDVLLVWWAFRANYRSARACEIVEVTPSRLVVRRVTHRGHRSEWSFNPYWVRLSVLRDSDGEAQRVTLASHGRSCEVGYWLSPPERDDFAGALGGAIASLKSGGAPA